MKKEAVRFDLHQLFDAIESERRHRKIGWAALSEQVGVSTTTIRRYREAKDAEADGVLALLRWLNVEPEHFTNSNQRGQKLPSVSAEIVRVDTAKIAAAVDQPAIAKRSRRTIQQLVDDGTRSELPIAALTRLARH